MRKVYVVGLGPGEEQYLTAEARAALDAAEGDFAICLYNPSSRKRKDYLRRACEILLRSRSGDTVCGWVRNIGREGQEHQLLTLDQLQNAELDMFTTVFIGSSRTRCVGGRLVTPRGYENK